MTYDERARIRRNHLVRRLHRQGYTQREIAQAVQLSQPMVCYILAAAAGRPRIRKRRSPHDPLGC